MSEDRAGMPLGRVDFGGAAREVSLACTPEAVVGDYVLVHAGVAISRLDEQEAREVFEYLAGLEAAEAAPERADALDVREPGDPGAGGR